MSLAFLLPLGLAALAAWLVPLLIHLRRRNETRRTVFAALHWLPAKARARTRLRFEEWPLLLVRLLLLAAIALLIAQPMLSGGPHAKHWLLVAPGVDPSALPASDQAEGERRWLATGFPGLEEAEPAQSQPIGSLLRELDASLPADAKLTVVVPPQLDGADAEVPVLHRRVDWQVGTAKAQAGSQAPLATPRPPLAIRHDEDTPGLRYLRAAAIAWQATTPASEPRREPADIAAPGEALPPHDTPLAWLAAGPVPPTLLAWVENGGTAVVASASRIPDMERNGIVILRGAEGTPRVRGMRLGRGRILQWTQPLAPQAMPELLEADFPERLWSLYAPPATPPARIDARAYAPRQGGRAWPAQPRDLTPLLVLVVAGLFLLERLFASGRREAVTA